MALVSCGPLDNDVLACDYIKALNEIYNYNTQFFFLRIVEPHKVTLWISNTKDIAIAETTLK